MHALGLGNLGEYRHKSYVSENWILWTTLLIADSMGLAAAACRLT